MGVLSRRHRGAVEFAGSLDFEEGGGEPLLKLSLEVNGGAPAELGANRMAWQRIFEWLPTFNSTVGDLAIRGTIFAPCGRDADLPGFAYALSIENRGRSSVSLVVRAIGALGLRQHRILTPRQFDEPHAATLHGDVLALGGAGGSGQSDEIALAMAGDGMTATVQPATGSAARFQLAREISLGAGESADLAIYVGAGPEADGAVAAARRLRSRGWRTLALETHEMLSVMQQLTGIATADHLINRHLMFAYFYAVGRAIDDAAWYLVRSRAPWCAQGCTLSDYEALMWVVPAIQLAEPGLARDMLVRICHLHGHYPGRGINYMDGVPFDISFCTAAAAAYPVAIDRYVASNGDDTIVDEPVIAEALYGAHEEIEHVRNLSVPLYNTESMPSGAYATLPYTLHANAIVAEALVVLRQVLDEKTAGTVQDPDAVRAAILRQFTRDKDSAQSYLSTAIDLAGESTMRDDPAGSVYWLPLYHMLSRDDSTYRRTVRHIDYEDRDAAVVNLAERCATLIGPEAAATLEWLRRADLDNGLAAEFVDGTGRAIGNGGDASLSALIAYTVWHAVSVLGIPAG